MINGLRKKSSCRDEAIMLKTVPIMLFSNTPLFANIIFPDQAIPTNDFNNM